MENSEQKKKRLPIGYWLKKADALLTDGIDEVQAEFGLSRTEWQVLNTLADTPDIPHATLLAVMRPFIEETQLDTILNKFKTSGLLDGKVPCHLSAEGAQLHSECLTQQTEFRQKAMRGISEQEYELTLRTLAKLVDNLS